mmetsp:Transcript_12728/g.26711  ORF Transcript_12728/g.26711 Transcript_12728/m.26711 type:complete len:434 (-) Transcript_12728:91-1392(-)
MMKGAIYTSFHSPITTSTTLPIPPIPPDGALIAIRATGVCRSDWHGWKGHDGDVRHFFQTHGPPFVPGHEASGVIVRLGSDLAAKQSSSSSSLRVGDRVAIPFILSCGTCRECLPPRNRPTICERQHQPGFTRWGTFAEYCAVSRAERNLREIPEGVSFVEAAALGCRFGTAFRAVLQQGRLLDVEERNGSGKEKEGRTHLFENREKYLSNYNGTIQKTVAVFGCGGLGLSCVAIASAFGAANIIAVDISPAALEKANELGATHTVQSPLLQPIPLWNDDNIAENNVYQQIMQFTEGMGVDLAIDAGGFEQTCLDALWTCRRGGTVVQVGLPSKTIAMPMARVAGREITVVGSHGFSSVEDDSGVSALDAILELVKCGKLEPAKLVDREVTLEEGVQALMDMDKGSPLGMVMITDFGPGVGAGAGADEITSRL